MTPADCGIVLGTKDASLGVRPKLTITYIPEPVTLLLLAGAVGAFLLARREWK